jgi:hypothetical protein
MNLQPVNQMIIQEDVHGENFISEEGQEEKKGLIKGQQRESMLDSPGNKDADFQNVADVSKLSHMNDVGFEEMAGTSQKTTTPPMTHSPTS